MGEEKKKDVLFERFLACATEEMPTQDLKDQVAEGLTSQAARCRDGAGFEEEVE